MKHGKKRTMKHFKAKNINKVTLILIVVGIMLLCTTMFFVNKKIIKNKEALRASAIPEYEIAEDTDVLLVDVSSEEELWEEIDAMEETVVETEAEKNDTNKNDKINFKDKYYIKVNCSANTVTIYENDGSGNFNPIKAMICSTGGATPKSGKYTIGAKYVWLPLFGNVYGHYCTRIGTSHILFHSVPYLENYNSGSLEYWEFDKLGTSASMGCIRLQIKDTKWIYATIPKGTTVEFYSDSNPGPLGKPSAPKISSNTACRNWDPTDDDGANPWRNNNQVQVQETPVTVVNIPNTNNNPNTNTTSETNNESNSETNNNIVNNEPVNPTEPGNTEQNNNTENNSENNTDYNTIINNETI